MNSQDHVNIRGRDLKCRGNSYGPGDCLAEAGSFCKTTGPLADVGAGATVTVFDAAGKAIGLGSVGEGALAKDADGYGAWSCGLPFTVTDVPELEDSIYSVEVSQRGQVNFSRADAANVILTLG